MTPRPRCPRIAWIGVLLACAAAHAFGQRPPSPWGTEPFAGDARAIAAAASALAKPEKVSSEFLLDDTLYRIEEDGRIVRREWRIVRVLTAPGVSDWSTVSISYSPWYQDKPAIRARVIAPDGSVRTLDPATIAEEPVGSDSRQIVTDRRRVRAPLPGVEASSVIEFELVRTDKAPLLAAGTVQSAWYSTLIPTRNARLAIDHPSGKPVRTHEFRMELFQSSHESQPGRERIRWEAFDLPADEVVPRDLPGDVPWWRGVMFTTGRSWEDVGRAYGEIVETQTRGAELESLVTERSSRAKDPRARIEALTRLLHETVRYTGVEFGDASVVPRTPVEVLQRKYGDCKDKAALLVAMLRAAKIDARVALLRTGPDLDSPADVPGLGYFDHAIVYVPGEPAIWIDATAEITRVGDLPAADQNRVALVTGPKPVLVRTPSSDASRNATIATYQVDLAELGPARWRVEILLRGAKADQYRILVRDHRPEMKDRLTKNLTKSEGVQFDTSDVSDLSSDFSVRAGGVLTEGATTRGDVATMHDDLGDLLGDVPKIFTETNSASDTSSQPARKRVQDYEFAIPTTNEQRFRITPPPGFRPGPFPECHDRSLGTFRFSCRIEVGKDGIVEAVMRFETGQRRITAEQLEQTRTALAEFRKNTRIVFRFDRTAAVALSEGRIRDALVEIRALAALHPGEAIHRAQLAQALLTAGLGEAAREEARKAAALEPGSAFAQNMLGMVLLHDRFGRELRAGFDRPGAIAAFRKAIELAPKEADYRYRLALAYEYDDAGNHNSSHAELDKAIEVYRTLAKEVGPTGYDDRLLEVLQFARRFGELEEETRKGEQTELRKAFRLIATAGSKNARAAIAEAGTLFPDPAERWKQVAAAASNLAILRLYPEASAFYAEAARGSSEAAKLQGKSELYARVRRVEQPPASELDPRTVVKRWFYASLVPSADQESKLTGLLTAEARPTLLEPEERRLARQLREVRRAVQEIGYTPEGSADVVLSTVALSVDGDEARGYRVRAQGAGLWGFPENFYLVCQGGACRIAGFDYETAGIGREVLRRAEAGDAAGARALLDWLREAITPRGGDDPFASPLFPRLWTKGDSQPLRIRLAAAGLMISKADAERAISVLGEYRGDPPELADGVDFARWLLWSALDKNEEVVRVTERMLARRPDSAQALWGQIRALEALGRWEEAGREADSRLRKAPTDPDLLRIAAETEARRGDLPASERHYRALIESGRANGFDFNNLAWQGLFVSPLPDRAFEDVRQALVMLPNRSTILHTASALYAEKGQIAAAREAFLKTVEASDDGENEPANWYLIGRMAEQYGEIEAARRAYARGLEKREKQRYANSVEALTRRRMEMMKAGTTPGS